MSAEGQQVITENIKNSKGNQFGITSTLSTKNLFYHFFLLHDFFQRLTKVKPNSTKYFDMQF